MFEVLALLLLQVPVQPAQVLLVTTGFLDDEVAAIDSGFQTEVAGCLGAPPRSLTLPTPCDDTCLVGLAAGGRLVSVEALRVGGDVDVAEVVVVGGVASHRRRSVPVPSLAGHILSPETCKALAPPVVVAPPPPKEEAPAAVVAVHPGLWLAGGGAVVAVVGLAGFAFDASVLEDPTSAGADKERARVTGWVWLAAAGVGVAAAAAGTAWTVVDSAP